MNEMENKIKELMIQLKEKDDTITQLQKEITQLKRKFLE
jgi:peptidoglycan hydrolase CwlO-like protein